MNLHWRLFLVLSALFCLPSLPLSSFSDVVEIWLFSNQPFRWFASDWDSLREPTQLLLMDVYFVLSYRLRLTVKPNSTLNFTPRVWKVSKAPNNNNSLLSLLIQLVLTLFWKMVSYDNTIEYQPIKGHKQWLCLPHHFVVTRVVSTGCQFTIWLGIAISNTCDFWFLFLCLFVCLFLF